MADRMERFPGALRALARGLPDADARWKPSPEDWSILEVVNHLADDEAEDIRVRLRLTLEAPGEPWPPVDAQAKAVERRYNDRDVNASVDRFARERAASLEWLRGLEAVDWEASHDEPKHGLLRAGDLMTAWAAHDALHLRQIAKRLHQLAERDGGGVSSAYAGSW